MIARLTLQAALDEATAAGLLTAAAQASARDALAAAARDDMPWYLRLLIGGAAWVGAWFLLGTVLGLVALAVGQRVDVAALVLGVGLIIGAVWLRATRHGEFARQTALVGVVTGQLLLVGGFGSVADSVQAATLATMASSIALILAYDDPVYRFSATLAIACATLILAFDRKVPYAMGLVTGLAVVAPVAIWRFWPGPAGASIPGWWQPLHRPLDPVAWASAVTACGLLAVQASIDAVTGTAGYTPDFVSLLLPRPWPLTALCVGLLAGLAFRIAADHGTEPGSPSLLGAVGGAVTLGALTLSTPAISGALLFVVLGFDRRRPGLVAIAATFLVGFLGLYYYSLSLTLLQKSAVLVASGVVCLGVAALFWLREPAVAA